ncbi:MAG: 2-dehydropantoate 2-reductase [Proteobacteria bacterium]|nr:2-dehydropantoate 2-reductase [Pseudomonadota bacterium]
MKIAVIGVGAVGGMVGAYLSGVASEVDLFDVSRPLVEAIASNGITVEMSSGEKKSHEVAITDDISSLGVVDLAIVCVKAYHTESAIRTALPIIGERTLVLSIQNGVGNIEIMADVIGDPHRIIAASLKSSVLPLSPGHLLYGKGEDLILGPMDNRIEQVHRDIAALLEKSGIRAEVTDNIHGILWTKVSHNVMNALAAVLWLKNDEYLLYPSAGKVWEKAVMEAAEVAAAQGIVIEDPDDPLTSPRKIFEIWRKAGSKGETTTMQDLSLGRRTEVDYINGAVVEAGRRFGIPTPINETLTLLVKAFEEKKGITN